MPSVRAKMFSAAITALVRRKSWGDEQALARRARRVFGMRKELEGIYSVGVDVEKVANARATGEWVRTARRQPGTILYLHGGGYVSCSARTHRPITARLAKLTNRQVFAANYRLAPENRFPAALDDATAAYLWLIEDEGISPSTIAVGGDSAGGGLTIALLIRLRDSHIPVPAAAFAYSPWTDLSGSSKSVAANDGKCAMFRVDNGVEFASAYLGTTSPTDPLASPLFADLNGLPPVLLHVGSTELLLDDSVRLNERIVSAEGRSTLEIYDDVPHGWQMLDGFIPEARDSLRKTAAFIEASLDK